MAENLNNGWITGSEKVQTYARVMHDESVRLTHLIDSVLDFSRMEATAERRRRVAVDPGELVQSVLARYQLQLSDLSFDLSTQIGPGLPRLDLDRDAMAQAIMNLIDNAIKYSQLQKV